MAVRAVPSHRLSAFRALVVTEQKNNNNNNPQEIMISVFIVSHGFRDKIRDSNLNNFGG